MMRALGVLVALVAALTGSLGAYAAIRAVGPDDRTGEYGFGDAATVPPGGGTLFESRNFAPVVAALVRALGPEAMLQSLSVRPDSATAVARAGERVRFVDVDAAARTRVRDGDLAEPAALVPLSRIDPTVVDGLVAGARRENRAPIDSLLVHGTREWLVTMERGEPDRFVANLDGTGLRLMGEPNPEPVGAAPDSLLRAENLERVFEAARAEAAAGARITDLDIRPERVMLTLESGGRELDLDYGYDAVLTRRDVRARSGAEVGSVAFEDLDPELVERMARETGKELGDIQYVLLNLSFDAPPELLMYLPEGSDPPNVRTPLRG
jgi:hypothetical protein